jgi:hypothetical protein
MDDLGKFDQRAGAARRLTHIIAPSTAVLAYGRRQALCGVRFDAYLAVPRDPSCPWCAQKLEEQKKGTDEA